MFVDKKINGNENYFKFYIMLFILLVSPIFIIIDHGHFQFNQVIHGLFIFSIYFLYKGNIFFGISFFILCINFKQMGLYYSIPIFLYIIKDTLNLSNNNIFQFIFYIIKYTIYVIFTFILIWAPWILIKNIEDVITRIFHKWDIKERKVANFWYLLNYFYELSNSENLIKYSIIIIIITIIIPFS
jgi:alpha-1,3-glucosyltransferase